jgi:hypothetical protein
MCQGLPEVGKMHFCFISRCLHFRAFTVAFFTSFFVSFFRNEAKNELKMAKKLLNAYETVVSIVYHKEFKVAITTD